LPDLSVTTPIQNGESTAGLSTDVRRLLAEEFNALIADHFALELRTLFCSSNTSGLHSHSVHQLLEEHAAALRAGTRKLGTRICSLAAAVRLSTLGELAQKQRLSIPASGNPDDRARLFELLESNQQLVEYIREAHALCDVHGDLTGARLLAALLEEAEGRSFQLFQIVRAG
jgi:starvation-inducible DNA-binding protein